MTKTISFKCTLLSDVIINQRAATEGQQDTLDFIPGNAFLGIAANELYKETTSETFLLFHTDKVCFGDAHPLVNGQKAIKIPASWYHKKGDEEKVIYIHHGMPKHGLKEVDKPLQVKQCREDFIVKTNSFEVAKIKPERNTAVKSAYDRKTRRSKDKEMYTYQSLKAGSTWCFDLLLQDEAVEYEEKLTRALTGNRRIGRSSTAQYGLAKIEELDAAVSLGFTLSGQSQDYILLYAESRLIFFDQYGQPTFSPTEEQLGLKKGEICWGKSQIRTFRYSPYNSKRNSYDAERCGIEKGSVFYIKKVNREDTQIEQRIGSYKNEGFGKVIINPEFLDYEGSDGKAVFSTLKDAATKECVCHSISQELPGDDSVWSYLEKQQECQKNQELIYSEVKGFVDDKAQFFKGEAFASQWGSIRSLATQAKNKEELISDLFDDKKGYLAHGVAAEKWDERGRREKLRTFIETLPEDIVCLAVINLAAEMAKKCKK